MQLKREISFIAIDLPEGRLFDSIDGELGGNA